MIHGKGVIVEDIICKIKGWN